MNDRVLSAMTILITACAVTVVALLVRREFFAPSTGAAPELRPVFVEQWERLLNEDQWKGRDSGRVRVVEFVDYQCPFCIRAEDRMDELLEQYPDDLALSYRHFPLPIHPHAFDAAVASECAGEQDRFAAFHDFLFADQESIRNESWITLARRAGVPDEERFLDCIEEDRPRDRVASDMALGDSIGITATPSFVVNGWLIVGMPALDSIEAVLDRNTR